MTKSYLSQDGHYRIKLRIEFRLTAEHLVSYLWDRYAFAIGRLDDGSLVEWSPDLKMTASQVDEAVRSSLAERGEQFFVENDDTFEYEGGKKWAEALICRTYGLPPIAEENAHGAAYYDRLRHRPRTSDAEHNRLAATARMNKVPYCRNCHDWHRPEQPHTPRKDAA